MNDELAAAIQTGARQLTSLQHTNDAITRVSQEIRALQDELSLLLEDRERQVTTYRATARTINTLLAREAATT